MRFPEPLLFNPHDRLAVQGERLGKARIVKEGADRRRGIDLNILETVKGRR